MWVLAMALLVMIEFEGVYLHTLPVSVHYAFAVVSRCAVVAPSCAAGVGQLSKFVGASLA